MSAINRFLTKGLAFGTVALASTLAYSFPSSQAGSASAHRAAPKVKVQSKSSLAKSAAILTKSRTGLFVENAGQWNGKAVTHAQGQGVDYWVTHNGMVMDFSRTATVGKKAMRIGHVVDMSFEGGETPSVTFEGLAKVKTDYLEYGSKKPIHAGSYSEVRLNKLYPGIDMRNYFDEQRPRYDLIVRPGADASNIKMAFKGQTKLSVSPTGNLVMGTSLGDMSQEGLKAFTVSSTGAKTPVSAKFQLLSNNEVGFSLGKYDHSAKLIIDPLIYGSYFGGNFGRDSVNAVTSTPDGGVYMTGWTESIFFPVITGAYQLNLVGARNAFVTLFRGDAYDVLYNTYIGGSVSFTGGGSDDEGKFVSISPDGTKLWVAGTTTDFDFAGNSQASFPLISPFSWMPAPTNTNMPNGWLVEFQIQPLIELVPYYATFVGPDPGASSFSLNGFTISPVDGSLLLAGTVNGTVDSADQVQGPVGPGTVDVWLLHLSPTTESANSPWQTSMGLTYFGGSQDDTVTGLSTDAQGDFVISGTVPSPLGATGFNQLDLSQNSNYFYTQLPEDANGTVIGTLWPNAQLLRGADLYAAKIRSDAAMDVYWSGVVGGSEDDYSAGYDFSLGTSTQYTYYDGTPLLSNSVATDALGDVYIVGFSSSFNYPRTSNVVGEINRQDTAVITQIATDGSGFIYSSGLNTTGITDPVGVAVDGAGNASITGLVKTGMIFAYNPPPPNPIVPNGDAAQGAVSVTGDAALNTYTWEDNSSVGEIPTDDAWLNVLNSTATKLLYGTYIGGVGNDTISYPFVDQFGDIWVFGETDTYFGYIVNPWQPASGTPPQPKFVSLDTPLPNAFLTPLGFKVNPDGPYPPPEPSPFTFSTIETNWLNDYAGGIFPYVNPTPFTGFGTVSMWESTDGYIFRFRIALPIISSVVLNPNTIPGGLGASTTGTITLSAPAPAQGADVQVTINTNLTAAQFLSGSAPYTYTVVIPSGATTGTFAISTNPVPSITPVQVESNYEGNIKFNTLTVIPWLQQFSVTPTVLPGGDNVSATITLSAPAPSGGITATVTADNPADLSETLPISITVPAGNTTVTVPITTNIVTVQSTVNLTATIAGVSQTAAVTLTPINVTISSISVTPSPLDAGGIASGTITLQNPAPDSGLTLNVQTSDASSAFFPPTPSDPYPSSVAVVIPAGSLVGTFTVNAGTIPTQTTVTISASDAANTVSTPVVVNAVGFSFTLAPASLPGGGTATGTITIAAPTTMDDLDFTITPGDANMTVNPGTVVIAGGGNTTGSFTVTTSKVLSDDDSSVTVTLGETSQQLPITITAATISNFSFKQSSIRSGHSDVGTVTLDQTVPDPLTITITYGPTGNTPPKTYFSQYTTSVTVGAQSSVSGPVTVTALRFTRPVTVPIQAAIGTAPNTGPAKGTTIGITR